MANIINSNNDGEELRDDDDDGDGRGGKYYPSDIRHQRSHRNVSVWHRIESESFFFFFLAFQEKKNNTNND